MSQAALDEHGDVPIFNSGKEHFHETQDYVLRIGHCLAAGLCVWPSPCYIDNTRSPAAPKSPSDKAGARVDARQTEQQKRIDAGVKSGELNQKEAARLQKGQANVQKMEDKARADGKITPQEARKIEHAQDQQSKKIYREKHDKQKAK